MGSDSTTARPLHPHGTINLPPAENPLGLATSQTDKYRGLFLVPKMTLPNTQAEEAAARSAQNFWQRIWTFLSGASTARESR